SYNYCMVVPHDATWGGSMFRTVAMCTAIAGMILAASPALAKKKAARVAGPNEHQLACLKQVGASIDPVTKRWMFYATERDGMGRIDMYKMCLAKGNRAAANRIGVYERASNPGSDQR